MALGIGTFQSVGGAVSDLVAGSAYKTRKAGNLLQAEQYGLAGDLARQNKEFAETSTAIKEQQEQRQVSAVIGQQQADVAASGFAESGSALDLLRDSAAQGALTKAGIGQQGEIEGDGYEGQAKTYDILRQSAQLAAQADEKAAKSSYFSAAIKGATAIASLFI